jgi:hypothetical protein
MISVKHATELFPAQRQSKPGRQVKQIFDFETCPFVCYFFQKYKIQKFRRI